MTPEQVGVLIERFGLPLVILGAFAALMLKRKLVTHGELQDKQDELDRMTAQYERERTDRITAEQGLVKHSAAAVDVAEAVRDALSVIAKRDPYTDRLEGTPRRGR